MHHKVLIVTTTTTGNKFPENFSCWYAGALEAKGCPTAVEIVPLDSFTDPMPSKSLKLQETKLKQLHRMLPTTEKLVLILPAYNNMLPVGVKPFIRLLATKKKYKASKLVTIDVDPVTYTPTQTQSYLHFSYPLQQLDTLFGLMLCSNRTQIKNSPSGNMCPLFAERYNDLYALIQQILDLGSTN